MLPWRKNGSLRFMKLSILALIMAMLIVSLLFAIPKEVKSVGASSVVENPSSSVYGSDLGVLDDNYFPQPITQWLVVKNGHFYINNTDTRVVLVGVNLGENLWLNYPNQTVRALVRQGFNFVRAGVDFEYSVSSGHWDDSNPNWNQAVWNNFYKFVEVCRQNGIYVMVGTGWDPRYGYSAQNKVLYFKNETSSGARAEIIRYWGKIAQTVGNRSNVIYDMIQNEMAGPNNNTIEFPRWNRWLQKTYGTMANLNATWGGKINAAREYPNNIWKVTPFANGPFLNASYNHGDEAQKDCARYCVERLMNITKDCDNKAKQYDGGKPLRICEPYAPDQWGYHMGDGDFVIGASLNSYFEKSIAGICPHRYNNWWGSASNLTRARTLVMGEFSWAEVTRFPGKAFILGEAGVTYTGEPVPQYMMPLMQMNYFNLYQADIDGVSWYCFGTADDAHTMFDTANMNDMPLWATRYTNIPYYAYWMTQMNRWFINRNQTYVQPQVAVIMNTHWGDISPAQIMFNLNLLHVPFDVIPASWLEYLGNVSYLNRYKMIIVCGGNEIGFNTTTFKQIVQWNKYNTTNYALYVGFNLYDDYKKKFTFQSIDFSGYLFSHSHDSSNCFADVSWGDDPATMKMNVNFGLLPKNTLVGRIYDRTYFPKCPYASDTGYTIIAYANSSWGNWAPNSKWAWYNSTCHAAMTYDCFQNTVQFTANDQGSGIPQNMTCWQWVFIPNYVRWINQTSIYSGQYDGYSTSIYSEYDGRYWTLRDFTGKFPSTSRTVGINSSLINTAKSYAVFNITDNTQPVTSIGTYTGTQIRNGISLNLNNFSWRLYVPLPTDAVHGITTVNASLASDAWTAGTKHSEIVVAGPSGINATVKIYIPSGIYGRDNFVVSCNETRWGESSWDSANRVLTMWIKLASAGKVIIDPLITSKYTLVRPCVLVKFYNSTPANGASVIISNASGTIWSGLTNSSGYFYSVIQKPNGTYTVFATIGSFSNQSTLNLQTNMTKANAMLLTLKSESLATIDINQSIHGSSLSTNSSNLALLFIGQGSLVFGIALTSFSTPKRRRKRLPFIIVSACILSVIVGAGIFAMLQYNYNMSPIVTVRSSPIQFLKGLNNTATIGPYGTWARMNLTMVGGSPFDYPSAMKIKNVDGKSHQIYVTLEPNPINLGIAQNITLKVITNTGTQIDVIKIYQGQVQQTVTQWITINAGSSFTVRIMLQSYVDAPPADIYLKLTLAVQ